MGELTLYGCRDCGYRTLVQVGRVYEGSGERWGRERFREPTRRGGGKQCSSPLGGAGCHQWRSGRRWRRPPFSSVPHFGRHFLAGGGGPGRRGQHGHGGGGEGGDPAGGVGRGRGVAAGRPPDSEVSNRGDKTFPLQEASSPGATATFIRGGKGKKAPRPNFSWPLFFRQRAPSCVGRLDGAFLAKFSLLRSRKKTSASTFQPAGKLKVKVEPAGHFRNREGRMQ